MEDGRWEMGPRTGIVRERKVLGWFQELGVLLGKASSSSMDALQSLLPIR